MCRRKKGLVPFRDANSIYEYLRKRTRVNLPGYFHFGRRFLTRRSLDFFRPDLQFRAKFQPSRKKLANSSPLFSLLPSPFFCPIRRCAVNQPRFHESGRLLSEKLERFPTPMLEQTKNTPKKKDILLKIGNDNLSSIITPRSIDRIIEEDPLDMDTWCRPITLN